MRKLFVLLLCMSGQVFATYDAKTELKMKEFEKKQCASSTYQQCVLDTCMNSSDRHCTDKCKQFAKNKCSQ